MKYEPIFFFEDLLADNRSLLNLIDSDFTYVNRRLAQHYGVRGEFREQPKKSRIARGQPPRRRAGHGCRLGGDVVFSSNEPGAPREMDS